MSLLDKLRKIAGSDNYDSTSKDLAKSWQEAVIEEGEMNELLATPGFSKIIEALRKDFIRRMSVVVSEDAELLAIKRMFVRTLGIQGASDQIEKYLKDFLEEPIDPLQK